ncbi:MAG: NAD(P)/FAD-dependent oxidoreductase [Frankiales bacterium]|nr:NAD(P)/FAD-dependent oxidoreductase [Frankiales bacterium]
MGANQQTSGRSRRIAIIGAGPGGMAAGIKLRAAGYEDFVIIEKSAGVGGTWYNTRYPGLTCDVKSRLYSFTFEPNPRWSRAYAAQPEILEYMDMVATKYGLRPHLRLGSKVTAAHWNEADACWRLTTDDEQELTVDVLIAAQGMFNELNWPEIEGLQDFEGTVFHASRWREDHELKGRKVAVIGSAASAVQFIPKIAPDVEQLYVYQRSAPWIAPKVDDAVDEAEQLALAQDPILTAQKRDEIYAELDGRITFSDPKLLAAATEAGLKNIESLQDQELREKFTPHVPFGCLRPLISNEYYPTFNQDHVELVTSGIERVAVNGIVSNDGTAREVDTIICATGYQVRKYLSAIKVTGRDGLALDDAWQHGPEAYLGIMTAGFPNLFMMYGPNTNNGSILFMLETQADFIVAQLRLMDRENLAWIDVRREVMDDYNEKLQDDLGQVEVWQASCSNYYRTPEGRIVTQWPHTMTEYEMRCQSVDDSRFETDRGILVDA